MNNSIVFKFQTTSLIHITKKDKLYKNELKKLFLKNCLMKYENDFYINDEIVDYVRIFGNIEFNIKIVDKKIVKKFYNFSKNKDLNKSKKISSLIIFIFFITIPLLIIFLFDSELVINVSAWFLSIIGFLFFSVTVLNQENNTYIEETNSKLSQINEMKSMFIANMSHELKTPISNILGLCQMLQENNNSQELMDIEAMGIRLIDMVNNLLFFSQSSFSQLKLNNNHFLLYDLLTDIYDVIKMRLEDKNIILKINDKFIDNFDDSYLTLDLYGDIGKISRILINLLTNAIKFTNNDTKIDLEFSYKLLKDNQIKLTFNVIDQGIGILQDKITRIFLPFVQADISTTREYGGNGLGLAICSQLVHLMNGNMKVTSKVNEGSDFEFYIILKYDVEKSPSSSKNSIINIIDNDNDDDDSFKEKLKLLPNTFINIIEKEDGLLTELICILLHNFDNIHINNNEINKIDLLIVTDIYQVEHDDLKILECSEEQINNYNYLKLPFQPNTFYKTIYEILSSRFI